MIRSSCSVSLLKALIDDLIAAIAISVIDTPIVYPRIPCVALAGTHKKDVVITVTNPKHMLAAPDSQPSPVVNNDLIATVEAMINDDTPVISRVPIIALIVSYKPIGIPICPLA
jgi:hypothetical protein